MKIYLVYPPGHTNISQPYTSLPCLTAVLKKNGHSVIQRDLGIEAIKYFTNTQNLQKSWEYVIRRFKGLSRDRSLSYRLKIKRRNLSALIQRAAKLEGNILNEWERAIHTLRDKKSFLDPKLFSSALNSIESTMKLISTKFYPTNWCMHGYQQQFTPSKISSLLKALSNKKENIFMYYLNEHIVPQIIKENPDVLGISISFLGQLIPGLTLAKLIKEKCKNIHICLGGNILMYLADALQKRREFFSLFDSVILYEGETAFLELLKRLNTDNDLSQVPNIIFYSKKRIVRSTLIHFEDLNQLPSPCYEGLPLDDYIVPEKTLVVNPSRGCYWNKCAFCGMCPGSHLKYRERKPAVFLADVAQLYHQHGVRYFSFNSDVISPNWLSHFADLVIDSKLTIYWDSEVRLEKEFTKELCRKLHNAGCRYLRFGFESANQRVLDLMRKGTKIHTAQRVINNCFNAGIRVGLETFAGFPGETWKEAEDTLNFIIRNKKKIGAVNNFAFHVDNYSAIYKFPQKFGVTIKRSNSLIKHRFDYTVKKGMSQDEAKKFNTYFIEKLREHNLTHLAAEFYNDACGSAYATLFASHYKTRPIL